MGAKELRRSHGERGESEQTGRREHTDGRKGQEGRDRVARWYIFTCPSPINWKTGGTGNGGTLATGKWTLDTRGW